MQITMKKRDGRGNPTNREVTHTSHLGAEIEAFYLNGGRTAEETKRTPASVIARIRKAQGAEVETED